MCKKFMRQINTRLNFSFVCISVLVICFKTICLFLSERLCLECLHLYQKSPFDFLYEESLLLVPLTGWNQNSLEVLMHNTRQEIV